MQHTGERSNKELAIEGPSHFVPFERVSANVRERSANQRGEPRPRHATPRSTSTHTALVRIWFRLRRHAVRAREETIMMKRPGFAVGVVATVFLGDPLDPLSGKAFAPDRSTRLLDNSGPYNILFSYRCVEYDFDRNDCQVGG
jgi:hypothetical protein